jgi:hypothetical protein
MALGVDSASNRNEYHEKWVTEMSTPIPGGKGCRCITLTTLPPSCAVVTKSGNFNFLESSGPLQACNGTALPLLISNTLHTLSVVSFLLKAWSRVPSNYDITVVPEVRKNLNICISLNKFSKCSNNNRKEWNDKRLLPHRARCSQVYVTAPEGYKTDVNKCTYALTFSVAHSMSEFCVTTTEH